MTNKYLYIPLEIVVRELDGKTTLAFYAALRGWKVVICTKKQLYSNLHLLPAGNVLVKSAVPNELKQLQKIRACGHEIFLLDEEGVVTYEIFLSGNFRFNEETLKLVNAFCFWGKIQYDIFTKNFPKQKNIGYITGNPRYDFWRRFAKKFYATEASKISNKYGKFILFNTSFGIANNYLSGEGLQSSYNDMAKGGSEELRKFLLDQHDINHIVYKEYLGFIADLANYFPNTNIVIRPHPSESETTWRQFAEKFKNVYVEYQGSATPWILASAVLVHFKSTTSIEANIMNVPAVTYIPPLPEYLEKLRLELPMLASTVCSSRIDTIKTLEKFLKNSFLDKNSLAGTEWIFDSKNPSMDILDAIEGTKVLSNETIGIKHFQINKTFISRIDELLVYLNGIALLNRFLPKKFIRHKHKKVYGTRKEKDFDFEHMQRLLRLISEHTDNKTKIIAKEIKRNVVFIEKI